MSDTYEIGTGLDLGYPIIRLDLDDPIIRAIRAIRDDEAEACIKAAISAEIEVIQAGGSAENPFGRAIVQAIRKRIADRDQG